MSPTNSKLNSFQRGVSLIELMISLTIGLALTVGLTILLSTSSSSFKQQDDFARLQENGVAALRYIGDDLRQAGFYGMGTTSDSITIAGTLAIPAANDCASALNDSATNWALYTFNPLVTYNYPLIDTANVNAYFPCIQAANYQNGSPILVMRFASGYRIPDPNNDGNLSDAALDANTVYLQSQPANGILFKGGDFAAGANLKGNNLTKTRLKRAGDSDPAVAAAAVGATVDFPIYEYQTHAYYIRPCSRPSGATCQPTDDNGMLIPTLVRQELVRLAMQEIPVVEGVERIGLLYGIDNNDDGTADQFTVAPNLAQWANVVSVKVSVLVRTVAPSAGYNDDNKSYDLGLGAGAIYSSNAALAAACIDCVLTGSNYKRHVFSQTFQVRNVAQRKEK